MSNSNLRPSMFGVFLQFLREGLVPPRRTLTDEQINNRRGWIFVAIGLLVFVGIVLGTSILMAHVSWWFGFGFVIALLWIMTLLIFLGWFEREYPSK